MLSRLLTYAYPTYILKVNNMKDLVMTTTGKQVDEFTLNPHDDQSFSLGSFTASTMPKGFSVEIISETSQPVISEIISSGTKSRCEFMLHLINHGDDTVQARVAVI